MIIHIVRGGKVERSPKPPDDHNKILRALARKTRLPVFNTGHIVTITVGGFEQIPPVLAGLSARTPLYCLTTQEARHLLLANRSELARNFSRVNTSGGAEGDKRVAAVHALGINFHVIGQYLLFDQIPSFAERQRLVCKEAERRKSGSPENINKRKRAELSPVQIFDTLEGCAREKIACCIPLFSSCERHRSSVLVEARQILLAAAQEDEEIARTLPNIPPDILPAT